MPEIKLHVCMLIDTWFPFVGGGQIHVKNLTKALNKRFPDIKIKLFHSPNHNIIIRSVWNLWVIFQVILSHRKEPFNIIHAHAFSAGLPGKILSTLVNIPVVFTVHGSHLMDQNQSTLKSFLENFLLTKISYTHQITVNKSFTKYPNVNNISVISNGVDIEAFNKIKAKKNKNITLLYVGRNHPTKGIKILKSAFTNIIQNYPNLQLQLITDGKTQGDVLIRAYKKAHIFVLPSLVEGQPLVLFEAWAAKLPVVVTATAGVKEVVTADKDVILAEPGSVSSLTKALNKAISMSADNLHQLAKNGYKKAAEQYTWDNVATSTYKVYLKALRT